MNQFSLREVTRSLVSPVKMIKDSFYFTKITIPLIHKILNILVFSILLTNIELLHAFPFNLKRTTNKKCNTFI